MIFVGIDPGLSGAIAILEDGKLTVHSCPETVADQWELLRHIPAREAQATIEHVHAFPGQGIVSTGKFLANYGSWLGMLAASLIPYIQVAPTVWQKTFGAMPKDKTARIWELGGEQVEVLYVNDDALRSAVFSPAGDRILTRTFHLRATAKLARVGIWNLQGKKLSSPGGGGVFCAAFSPTGDRILIANGVFKTASFS